MKPARRALLGLGAAPLLIGITARAGPDDSDQIRRLQADYARVVDTLDMDLARQIWSASPDVSFIHPLGHDHGFDQIRQNLYQHIMGGMFSERTLNLHDPAIHVYGEAAWAEFDWDFTAKQRSNGAPVRSAGRETQIYRKEDGQWRLVHVHYSEMPRFQLPK